MTVVLHAVIKTFTGLAADSKPTDAPDGSRFYETDTGVVYIFSDSAWTVLSPAIQGPVASDAVASGNPVPVGGDVDDTTPAAAAEGDRRVFRATPEGNQIVEPYLNNVTHLIADDAAFTPATSPVAPIGALGDETSFDSIDEGDIGVPAMTLDRELYIRPMRHGASEVKSITVKSSNATTTLEVLLSPTSGKKVRVLSISATHSGNGEGLVECYFASGTNYGSAITKAIALNYMEATNSTDGIGDHNFFNSWPDGAGPVGEADDDVSIRTPVDMGGSLQWTLHYREE